MGEVIGEVVVGICELVVEVTAEAIGSIASGNEKGKKKLYRIKAVRYIFLQLLFFQSTICNLTKRGIENNK